MDIKHPTAPCICCYTTLWNINVSKTKAINDKLQGSLATYLRSGGVVNNQIKKDLLLSLWVIFFKSVKIWQRYKRGCLMHFARLVNTLLTDEESARDNHVLACNFTNYSPILICFRCQTQQ